MSNIKIKTNTIRFLFLIVGILVLSSCKNDRKSTSDKEVNSETENLLVEEKFLIGSWEDTSPSALHFTIFENGTARSDNMKTLLYKNWSVNQNKITFTVESIGSGTSFTDTVTYGILKLTNDELLLINGTSLFEFTKEKMQIR